MTEAGAENVGLIARIRAQLAAVIRSGDETARLAATAFVIRVVSAALAYVSQVVLARWMGTSEYGVYVYVWTWVLLLGSIMDFGIAVSAQKFIPEYRSAGKSDLLRGFVGGARRLTFGVSAAASLLFAGIVWLVSPLLDERAVVPFYLACLTLPAFVLANTQDGIARSYDWMKLAFLPQFIARQALIISFTAGAVVLGFTLDATAAMLASAISVWLSVGVQTVVLERRLRHTIEAGSRVYNVGGWLKTSLPIMMVEGFYLILTYTDILVLEFFRPSSEVGVYFAAVKTLALVSFVHFAMSATTAHRFAEYNAAGDRERLAAYLVQAAKWTFWPSVGATALLLLFGEPLLWLFGPQFTDGYGIMFVAAVGLLARAAVGPVERLLNMLGEQYACARVYALAALINLVLCVALVPSFGGYGAAAATSIALTVETVLLFIVTRRRLGYSSLPFGSGQ